MGDVSSGVRSYRYRSFFVRDVVVREVVLDGVDRSGGYVVVFRVTGVTGVGHVVA